MIYRNDPLIFSQIVTDVFDVVSMASTTGFVASNFSQWPHFLPILMIAVAMVGGCAASTTGGIKVVRLILMWKVSLREVKRLIHPNAVLPIKINNSLLPRTVMDAVWGFVAIYIILFTALLFLLMITGLNFETAFGALASCLSNAGASIAGVSTGFYHLGSTSKWILIIAMLAGRLEIFTLFMIFLPSFWRY